MILVRLIHPQTNRLKTKRQRINRIRQTNNSVFLKPWGFSS